MSNEILFSVVNGAIGKIMLNRPQALNALSKEMFITLQAQLVKWNNDSSVKAIIIRSHSAKAFCAGGDIRAIYENKHHAAEIPKYFRLEYDVNKLMVNYNKPIISFLQGITMGGGVGISIHGSHSISAENLRWAMPETSIGFFPDVGSTYYLSRLPHHMGTYLALTGNSINAQDALEVEFIDAIVPAEKFDEVENALAKTIASDHSAAAITKTIQAFAVPHAKKTSPNEKDMATCFQYDSVEKIMAALTTLHSPWALAVLEKLQHASPTSLKVTFQQLQFAKQKTCDEVIDMDFHIACEMLRNHDFFEGIRAAVIDKDKMPHWKPDALRDVSDERVMRYFKSIS